MTVESYNTIPTLSHATERDIDLFIVEELICSPTTVDWFLEQSGINLSYAKHEVKHSKRRTRNRREIDIFVEGHFLSGKPAWALLIENKIDANEQPDQAESYREELVRHYQAHKFSKAVLIAPQAYGDAHSNFCSKFDVFISYEAFIDFLEKREKANKVDIARDKFKVDCFLQAITKQRRGYKKIANQKIRDFNRDYVSLMRSITPELIPGKTMLTPTKPDESVSMILDNSILKSLPKNIRPRRFSIELGKNSTRRANYVAVTFAGWGHAIDAIQENYNSISSDTLLAFGALTVISIEYSLCI